MHKSLLFTLLFVFLSLVPLRAQTILYPVKKNHLWGYINKRGKVVVEPTYNLISSTNMPWNAVDLRKGKETSPFKVVELGNKMGLVDEFYKTVIPPNYQGIRPLNADYFAVKDSINSDYYIIDRDENVILKTTYHDIQYLGTNERTQRPFFLIRQGDLYGVCSREEKPIIPVAYAKIRLVSPNADYFKVMSPTTSEKKETQVPIEEDKEPKPTVLWSIIDTNNKVIVDEVCEKIKVCHPNFIGYKDYRKTHWEACDGSGKPILNDEIAYVRSLTPDVVFAKRLKQASLLYNAETQSFIEPSIHYETYEPLTPMHDHLFMTRTKAGRSQKGLMDSKGNMILSAEYTHVSSTDADSLFVVHLGRSQGVWHLTKELIIPTQYDKCKVLENGLISVQSNSSLGCMNQEGVEIVPIQFQRIQLDGLILNAYQGKEVHQYELNEAGKVVGLDRFENVRRFKTKKKKAGVQARAINRKKEAIDENKYFFEYPSPRGIEESAWDWAIRKETGMIYHELEKSPRTHPDLTGKVWSNIAYIGEARMSLHYPQQNTNVPGLAAISPRLRAAYLGQLFLHDRGKMLKQRFFGIRRHDFERQLPFAPAILANGKIALLDEHGNLKTTEGKPDVFTYIGEFEDGYARACVGGKLSNLEDLNLFKYTLLDIKNFVEHYHIRSEKDGQRSAKGRLMVVADEESVPQWGLIDSLGNWVIQPQYEYLSDNYDGQTVAVKEGKWGVIDLENQPVLDFIYARVTPYYGAWKINGRSQGLIYYNDRGWQISDYEYTDRGQYREGFCAVKKDGKWGYTREDGSLAIPCEYEQSNAFSEGLAAVKTDEKWAFIDTSGQIMAQLPDVVDTLGNLSDSMVWYQSGTNFGFLNRKGEVAIEATFQQVSSFENGVAIATLKAKKGLINKLGTFIVPPTYARISPFDKKQKVAIVQPKLKPNLKALMNTKGELITPVKYNYIGDFSEGIAPVSDGRYYGYINSAGKELGELKYTKVEAFSDGMAAAKSMQGGKWHYINKNGSSVFQKDLKEAGAFYDGLALVKDYRDNSYLIDKKGKKVQKATDIVFVNDGIVGRLEPRIENIKQRYIYTNLEGNKLFTYRYDEVNPFQGDFAIVRKGRKMGVINKRGNYVVRPKYFYLILDDNGQMIAGPPAFGIADRNGKILIDAIYDNIELMTGNIYRVEQGEKVAYVKEDGTVVWDLQN